MNTPFDCITDFIFVETEITPANAILIPGANHPPLMERAISLYNEGFAPYLLPSGGYNPHVGTTEWEYLQNIALEHGVPSEVIIKEDQAQHTLENARFSLEVLEKASIQHQKVIIVCKAIHSRRALLCYQAVFPKETEFLVVPVIDRYELTKENWFLSEVGISRVMTEVEKIGKYFRTHIPNWVQQSAMKG
ncbi:YdcF family protein [Anaerobacillus alkaliphilus]|uniref:YdcF family protein n=1 Tax=Anaerobacillus alkaliphilus TaxID=1548597 RepID=A0A4Q0VLR3_9BACI|nr:YdcF family protein [Anaerobacillus alkaliphilus]RXI96371.1 YdcF family protein [Anaerobacillus alkaliphilus]